MNIFMRAMKGRYSIKMATPDPASQTTGDIKSTPADFETAVKEAGFGRFNILLLLVVCPGAMATVIVTAVVSYILPTAECDLSLDLMDKGILNAVAYCGMILSAIGWGYLADTRGRKKLLVWGYLIDVVCTVFSALSQNVVQLMISKFVGGFVMCGPFAILMSYISEYHGSKYRERILMLIGVMFSTATLMLPLLAVLILPNDWNFDVLNMSFTSWKVYLAVCGIPSLLSGLLICLFPETPRFLMSQGRNAEALETFKTMYAINSGKPKDTYPIKELINDNPARENVMPDKLYMAAMGEAIVRVVPTIPEDNTNADDDDPEKDAIPTSSKALCFKPYLSLTFRVCLMNFFILLGQITVRLWLPQLFASLYEYEKISTEATTSMCSVLEYNLNKTELMKNPTDECVVVITASTYTNNIIVSAVSFIGFLVAGTLVNTLGNKLIQVISLAIAGTCGIALYWSSTALTTLIISSLYVCMSSIASTTSIGTSVNLFPTSLRTMIVSLSWMFGRMGSIMGNILFPAFMSFGCVPPFLLIGIVMYLGCILSILLPSTKKLELK